ncbi:hypothetical protein [Clostridium perfringens]|uniref:hypothetical protein n=1 Tax=Clostridium perfringens TaxID=1502 RepID=UPI0018E3FCE3|nr:hypothetical protein [Clostridium perfringens]EJT6154957.1 hypothetical protein [Clostridium perfringens]MBI6036594.1 hypothetical protein [Clostridium perfringens]MDK0596143.1 hypothetical protein [Clostridium perfringens]MDK0943430.1 hypothetical protein [Clostridium perfringens]MDM0648954.1 hypothetical protein [Clostridium perfringens]
MRKVINLANYKKERESLLDEEEVIYDIGDLDIKKTENGKLLVWIEGHIYFESLEDLKATYIDFRDSVCNDFNIINNNKLDEVDFKLEYSKKSEFYNLNVNDFYINDYENLVEKLNYIISNIKKDNVEIQE